MIKLGTDNVNNIWLGTNKVSRIWKDTDLVYTAEQPLNFVSMDTLIDTNTIIYGGKYLGNVFETTQNKVSANGVNWTSTNYYGNLSYANGRYFTGQYTSTDGTNWTQITGNPLSGVTTYFKGKYVALTNDSGAYIISYSEDGITWTSSQGILGTCTQFITDGETLVFADKSNGKIWYSTNGTSWTDSGTATGDASNAFYVNNTFCIYGYAYTAYSSDGVNWNTTSATATQSQLYLIDGAVYECFGNTLLKSTNGYTFSNVIVWNNIRANKIVKRGSKFYVVNLNDYYLYESTDLINWATTTTDIQFNTTYISVVNNKMFAMNKTYNATYYGG